MGAHVQLYPTHDTFKMHDLWVMGIITHQLSAHLCLAVPEVWKSGEIRARAYVCIK